MKSNSHKKHTSKRQSLTRPLVSMKWPCMAGESIIEYINTPAGTRLPYTAAMLQRRRERLNAESQALFEAL